MGLEILRERSAGTHSGLRGATWSVLAFLRKYPTSTAIAWTILLLALCLAPERIMSVEDSQSYKEYIPHTDLLAHFALFAGFAFAWTQSGRSAVRWVAVAAVGLLLAVGTEYAQNLPVIHRDGNLLDGLADCLGVAAGLVASAIVGRWSSTSSGDAAAR